MEAASTSETSVNFYQTSVDVKYITSSFSYVTERGKGRWKGQGAARRQRFSLSMYSVTEYIFSPFNFDTIGGIFIH
jgi:hypothetical protein